MKPIEHQNDLWLIHSEKESLKTVAKDYTRYVFVGNVEYQITIFAGSKTDLATIPRPLWVIYPRDGEYAEAAAIHDLLYYKRYLDRGLCDTIFYELMKQDSVDILTRNLFYKAVRMFGGLYYYKASSVKRGDMKGIIRKIKN